MSTTLFSLVGTESVLARQNCGVKIGAGGNVRTMEGRLLKGRCVNGAFPAMALADPDHTGFLRFSTGPGDPHDPLNSRTELCYMPFTPFGSRVRITARIRIPSTSSVTDQFQSIIQLWQHGGPNPMFRVGLRRGTSHRLNIRSAGDGPGRFLASLDVPPDTWRTLSLCLTPSPGVPTPASLHLDGTLVAERMLRIGRVPSHGDIPGYRLKFGIYRHPQHSRYVVDIATMKFELLHP